MDLSAPSAQRDGQSTTALLSSMPVEETARTWRQRGFESGEAGARASGLLYHVSGTLIPAHAPPPPHAHAGMAHNSLQPGPPPDMPPAPPRQNIQPHTQPHAQRPMVREGVKSQPRSCGMPVSKRTMAELKADEKKTGIRVPEDLPTDFPRGPWVVDLSKSPEHAPATGQHDGGWKYQEEQMIVQWKCWCSDPNTPLDCPGLDLNRFCRGGFPLAGTTRSTPTSQTGTVKRARCTGRSDGDKGQQRPCSFKIQAEFVAEVLPGKHGWVLRSVEGGDHMLADSHGGKAHALIHSLSAVMESGRLRKGTSRLRQAEYFKTGMRMKMAGNTCAMIHETLRIVAQEEGRDVLWNLADIKEVFGLDSKKRVANADKSTIDDKYERCLAQCRDMCAKVKGNEEDCEFLFHHLSKFDRQLTLHRRKRKASVALDTHSPNGEDLADADKIGSPQIMGIIGFQPPAPMQQQQQLQQQQVQM